MFVRFRTFVWGHPRDEADGHRSACWKTRACTTRTVVRSLSNNSSSGVTQPSEGSLPFAI